MSKWQEETATECGHTVYILEDWDVPRYCRECKEERDSHWSEVQCQTPGCNNMIRVHDEWEHPPKYCEECKASWPEDQELTCSICSSTFTWSGVAQKKAAENGWQAPSKCPDCRNFIKTTASTYIPCKFCEEPIEWNSFQQLMEEYQHWTKQSVCKDCKENRKLLIAGALGQFEGRGIHVHDEQETSNHWVAVVRDADGNTLAYIKIQKKGKDKIAITYLNSENNEIKHTRLESPFLVGRRATTYGIKPSDKEPVTDTYLQPGPLNTTIASSRKRGNKKVKKSFFR